MTIADDTRLWVAAERLKALQWIFPDARIDPVIRPVDSNEAVDRESALVEILSSRMEGLGPVTAAQLAASMRLDASAVEHALLALQQEGGIIQGKFTPAAETTEWCERGLLARIHRYTLKQLRSEIEPVAPADFMRFLFRWQGLDDPGTGETALQQRLLQLEGLSLPAASWEADILPARIRPYAASDLDKLCSAGKISLAAPAPARRCTETQESGRQNYGLQLHCPRTPAALARLFAITRY